MTDVKSYVARRILKPTAKKPIPCCWVCEEPVTDPEKTVYILSKDKKERFFHDACFQIWGNWE